MTSEWILVLALTAGGSGNAGKALTTVRSYEKAECEFVAQGVKAAKLVDRAFCIPGPAGAHSAR